MTLLSAAILLFLILDPLGNMPLFVTELARVAPERRRRVLIRELLIALPVLLIFLFCGKFVVSALQISGPSLTIAGGVVLFLIALRMIFPSKEGYFYDKVSEEPFIVPLAIPLVAGPSALATILLMVSREPEGLFVKWFPALLIAWTTSAILLSLSGPLSRLLGTRGLVALERLMGMILITVAVQMFMTGIQSALVH
jgi:multiple antibiotic resistance protein